MEVQQSRGNEWSSCLHCASDLLGTHRGQHSLYPLGRQLGDFSVISVILRSNIGVSATPKVGWARTF